MTCCCGDYYGFSVGTRTETLVNVARFDVLSDPSSAPDSIWRKFHKAATGFIESDGEPICDDAYCCRVLSDDSIVTGGAYTNTAQTATGGGKYLLSKWSNSGSQLATYSTYNDSTREGCGQIERDDDDNIYCVVASLDASATATGSELLSFDADLNLRWNRSYSALQGDDIASIAVDGGGNTYLCNRRYQSTFPAWQPTGFVLDSSGSITETFATVGTGGPFDSYYTNGTNHWAIDRANVGYQSIALDDQYVYMIARVTKGAGFSGSVITSVISSVYAAYKFDKSTGAIVSFKENATNPGQWWLAHNIEFDPSGNLYYLQNTNVAGTTCLLHKISADFSTWSTVTLPFAFRPGGRSPFEPPLNIGFIRHWGTRRTLIVNQDESKYLCGVGTHRLIKLNTSNTAVWTSAWHAPPEDKSETNNSGGATSMDLDSAGQLVSTAWGA